MITQGRVTIPTPTNDNSRCVIITAHRKPQMLGRITQDEFFRRQKEIMERSK